MMHRLHSLHLMPAKIVGPLSQFLLWLGPIGSKGSNAEWIMMAFHLVFPLVLLLVFWRGRMKAPLSLRDDLPIFAVAGLFHLADIIATLVANQADVLWLVLTASLVHWGSRY